MHPDVSAPVSRRRVRRGLLPRLQDRPDPHRHRRRRGGTADSRGVRLVLRASDLRAFEVVAGTTGLLLEHPAELVIPVRPADYVNAREFAAELTLAVAEMGAVAISMVVDRSGQLVGMPDVHARGVGARDAGVGGEVELVRLLRVDQPQAADLVADNRQALDAVR